jgi:hypothetical protein
MCDSCEVLNINGMNCHETGCPEAWKDYKRKCKWCGGAFKPESRNQVYCCDDCFQSDSGLVARGEES